MTTAEDIAAIRASMNETGAKMSAWDALDRLEKVVERPVIQIAPEAVQLEYDLRNPKIEYEYGWAGDAQATTFYDTKEEAEEYMGEPKRFARVKAGPWEEVEG